MAEDRFGDLGAEAERKRPSAAELLAAGDEEELRAERKLEQRHVPKPSSAYAWVVGIVFLLLIIVVGVNSLPNAGEGLKGPRPGTLMPEFAAPLATGTLNKDVNVKATGRAPGATFACAVHVPSALNGCDIRRRPSVLVFAGTRGANCLPGFDRVERVRKAFPQVNFAGILIKMDLKGAAKVVEKGHWGFPVAFDRDGQLTNVYGLGVCPATIFARKGGRVVATRLGKMTEAQLKAQIRRIL